MTKRKLSTPSYPNSSKYFDSYPIHQDHIYIFPSQYHGEGFKEKELKARQGVQDKKLKRRQGDEGKTRRSR
jgi:hypothetical protein